MMDVILENEGKNDENIKKIIKFNERFKFLFLIRCYICIFVNNIFKICVVIIQYFY